MGQGHKASIAGSTFTVSAERSTSGIPMPQKRVTYLSVSTCRRTDACKIETFLIPKLILSCQLHRCQLVEGRL